MKKIITNPTYIVLDISDPICSQIAELRKKFDPIVAKLPVEITVIGSSGIGTITEGQKQEEIFAILENISKSIKEFSTSFKKISQFPNTDIFYLEPDNKENFEAIQQAIISTKIKFNPNPFAYTPHCTIRSVGAIKKEDAVKIIKSPFPKDIFTLNKLSVYELINTTCNLLFQTNLKMIKKIK